MPFGLQPIHLIIVAIVALLIFGPSRLPEIGRGVGKAINEFRRGAKDMGGSFMEEIKQTDETQNRPDVSQAVTPAVPVTPPLASTPEVPVTPPLASTTAAPMTPPLASTTEQVSQGNFCIHCGKSNPSGAIFCNQCGSKIAE